MGSDQNRQGLVEDKEGFFEVPEGNLTALAEDEFGSVAIGITSIFWLLWTVISMFIPWNGVSGYQAPIIQIFTLTGSQGIFYSFLPTGYLVAWLVNIVLYLIELIAWMVNGQFYITWATVGCWGGFFFAALPWVFEVIYILSEYPTRNNTAWIFIWS